LGTRHGSEEVEGSGERGIGGEEQVVEMCAGGDGDVWRGANAVGEALVVKFPFAGGMRLIK
jgi:hypothetical protein